MPEKYYECPACQPRRGPGKTEANPLKAFIDQCAWTWTIYSQFRALSEGSPQDYKLMNEFAGAFLGDVQEVFHDYVLLRMCVATDAPSYEAQPGVYVENLSLENILAEAKLPAPLAAELRAKVDRINEIVKPIRKARDRIIAHTHKENALRNHSLGQFKEGEDEEFFDLLDEVVNAIHRETHGGGPYSIKVAAADRPVSDLVIHLRMLAADRGQELAGE